jgi:hypothetical protein
MHTHIPVFLQALESFLISFVFTKLARSRPLLPCKGAQAASVATEAPGPRHGCAIVCNDTASCLRPTYQASSTLRYDLEVNTCVLALDNCERDDAVLQLKSSRAKTALALCYKGSCRRCPLSTARVDVPRMQCVHKSKLPGQSSSCSRTMDMLPILMLALVRCDARVVEIFRINQFWRVRFSLAACSSLV